MVDSRYTPIAASAVPMTGKILYLPIRLMI